MTTASDGDPGDATSQPAPVRVIIVDDYQVIRQGLRANLGLDDRIYVAGEAADGQEALELAERVQPDVVLLDVRMPRRDGLSVAEELASRYKVVMVTGSTEDETVQAAVRAGAVGYLVHGNFEAAEIVTCVLNAAGGKGTFSEPAVRSLQGALSRVRSRAPGLDRFGLTAREAEIMDLVAMEGLSNLEIVQRLCLGESTVKNHMTNIRSKLQVTSRAAAVSLWLRGPQ